MNDSGQLYKMQVIDYITIFARSIDPGIETQAFE